MYWNRGKNNYDVIAELVILLFFPCIKILISLKSVEVFAWCSSGFLYAVLIRPTKPPIVSPDWPESNKNGAICFLDLWLRSCSINLVLTQSVDQTIIQDVHIDLAKDDLTILEEHPHSGQRFDVFVSPRLALSSWEPEFQGCLDHQGVFGLHPRVHKPMCSGPFTGKCTFWVLSHSRK